MIWKDKKTFSKMKNKKWEAKWIKMNLVTHLHKCRPNLFGIYPSIHLSLFVCACILSNHSGSVPYHTLLYCSWSSFALCVPQIGIWAPSMHPYSALLYNARTIIECTYVMILLDNGTCIVQLDKALYGCIEGAHILICGIHRANDDQLQYGIIWIQCNCSKHMHIQITIDK